MGERQTDEGKDDGEGVTHPKRKPAISRGDKGTSDVVWRFSILGSINVSKITSIDHSTAPWHLRERRKSQAALTIHINMPPSEIFTGFTRIQTKSLAQNST